MFGKDDVIHVGMIGAGGNARAHMTGMLAIENVTVEALADPSPEARTAALKRCADEGAEVAAFADYREMLEAVELDAVVISTPHTLHFEQIMTSLDAGLHVFAEKPMVCTVAETEAVIRKVRDTGLIAGISYQRHLLAPYRYCREKIASGKIGDCYYVSAWQSQNWYRGQVLNNTWRSKPEWSGGGQLNDSGSHLLDVILWVMDDRPVEVFAYQDNKGADVDILSAISMKFESGALCNMSIVGHAVNFHEEITFFCEDATLSIQGNGAEVWSWKDEQREVIAQDDLGKSWARDENFIAALRGEQDIQAPVEGFLDVAKLTEAIWESARSSQPVKIGI